jgi:hypothetical protein
MASCSRDKLTLVNDNVSPQTKAIITKANELELSIEEGQLMRNSSPDDKARLIVHIQRMKGAIINLERNPNDKSALITLTSSLQMINSDQIQILENDRDRLDSFFDEARYLLAGYTNAQIANNTVTVNELSAFSTDDVGDGLLTWSLFWDSFADKGIEDVMVGNQEQTVSTLANFNIQYNSLSSERKPLISRWDIRTNTINPVDGDSVYIASGRDVNGSWMLTTCDFTNVRNPSVMFNHSLTINKNTKLSKFQPNEMLRETFFLFGSSSYDGGQPLIPTSDDSGWDNLNLFDSEGIPSGQDFHTVDSSKISLKQYEGKVATIGFYFDFNENKHGRHYLSWQLNYFEIFGSSTSPVNCTDPRNVFAEKVAPVDTDSIFLHRFETGIGEFNQVTREGDPIEFKSGEHNGTAFFEISGFSTKSQGTQLLYSPAIDLTGHESPAVSITQTGNFYPPAAQEKSLMRLMIALDEEGKNALELDWEVVPFTTLPNWKWDVVTTEWLKLDSKYKDKKVRVAFEYSTDKESDVFPTWQIYNVWLKNITE